MNPKQLKEEATPLENPVSTENLTSSELIEKLFLESDSVKQWEFIHEYKEYGKFILDNDWTTFRVETDDSFTDSDGVFDLELGEPIGNNPGICNLLNSLGFKYERT